MKVLLVSPADAGKTVAQLLGEVETKAARTLVLEPGAYPPAVVLANFKEKDVDTLLDAMKQAQVTIPLKAVVTPPTAIGCSAICWPTCRRSTPPLPPQRRTTPYEDPRKTFRQRPAGRGALPEPAGRLCLQKKELTRYSTVFYDVFDTVTQVMRLLRERGRIQHPDGCPARRPYYL